MNKKNMRSLNEFKDQFGDTFKILEVNKEDV